jgi:hypothetical protein
MRRRTLFLVAAIAIAAIVIAIALGRAPTRSEPAPVAATTSSTPTEAKRPKARHTAEGKADTARVTRARWEERRARIDAAREHAEKISEARPPAATPRPCIGDDCPAVDPLEEQLFASFNAETTALVEGCEDFIGKQAAPIRISARLVGAPDVGTIIESIDVSGSPETNAELTECLTEGMYALELAAPSDAFTRDLSLGLGLLDAIAAHGWLPPEAIEQSRAAMLAGGLDPASDPMVYVAEDEAPPSEP